MGYRFFALLLILNAVTASELLAQTPTRGAIARQQFNQVFVKVIVPVTERTPKQDGPVVESWVSKQLKEAGQSEYFAVTNWVPVCDGLLADDDVNNDIWNGKLFGRRTGNFCPVGGDLPERKDGRVVVLANGWDPGGGHEARVELLDEPGTRTVEPVLPSNARKDRTRTEGVKPIAYVAILIGPPPSASIASQINVKSTEQKGH
ncbi:MAG: hypothetical protein JNM43_01865 [Planctomycetaceae bacterium]|nr:hypothetical protein [Planctomycetaceae bacterium]